MNAGTTELADDVPTIPSALIGLEHQTPGQLAIERVRHRKRRRRVKALSFALLAVAAGAAYLALL